MDTLFCTVPFIQHCTFSAAIFIRRLLASSDAQAMCGVITQFFAVSSGLSAFGGSVESTSIPAPAMRPSFSALASASSSMTGPREELMRMAFGFINASVSSLMR